MFRGRNSASVGGCLVRLLISANQPVAVLFLQIAEDLMREQALRERTIATIQHNAIG
jgi:hypothetical protein